MQAELLELGLILDDRVKYNHYWRKVDLIVRSRYLEIKWYQPRNRPKKFDPKGKRAFKTARIAPLNMDVLKEEIRRQKLKLKRDMKDG